MAVRYAREFIALVRHRYEDTHDTLAKIALDCGISERAVNRMRDREGWTRRSDRVRDVLPVVSLLEEATALLARPAVERETTEAPADRESDSSARPRAGGDPEPRAERVAPGFPLARERAEEARIARIERLVEKELAAEEAMRAQLGPLPRVPADAERSARTLATLTQTLQALARLRCGLPPDGGFDDDDDMPRDIDEFRRDLARRIDAFVASRTEPGHAQGDCGPATVDEGR